MAKRKKNIRAEINELKVLLISETSNVENGILFEAKRTFTDDLRQRKISRAIAIIREL